MRSSSADRAGVKLVGARGGREGCGVEVVDGSAEAINALIFASSSAVGADSISISY